MRKLKVMLALALLAGVFSASFAENRTVQWPVGRDGRPADPLAAGARWHRHTLVTETNPVDGPVILLGVILYNTGAAPVSGAYVQYRDTSETTVSADGVNIVARLRFDFNTGDNFPLLPFPIYLESGFGVRLSDNSNGEAVTTLYMDVRDLN